MAYKLFGKDNPVGQSIMIGEDSIMIANTIKGVFKDLPANTHFHFDLLQSYNDPKANPYWAYIYLKLRKGAKPTDILKGMTDFIRKFENEENSKHFKPFLQNVTDIHLYSHKDREIEPNGDITEVYLFIFVAFIVLLVAWVNYYNLNNVRVIKFKKQIHVQAIIGSGYFRLITQSVFESGICTAIVLNCCFLFSDLFNNYLSQIIGFHLLPHGFRDLLSVWPIVAAMLVFTIFAGCLPFLFHLWKMQQMGIQSTGKAKYTKRWAFSSRGLLVTVQFVMAILLMFSATVIYKQKQFILGHSMGNMNDDIIMMNNANWETRSINNIFRQKVFESPLIRDFTSVMEEPSGETMDGCSFETQGVKDTSLKNSIFILPVEDNFFNFFNIEMIAGNNFRTYNEKSHYQDYILNETAVKRLGWTPEEAIGKPFKLKFFMPGFFQGGTIVGVVRNFHFTNLRQEIKPYAFMQQRIFQTYYLIKIDTSHHTEAIRFLNNLWAELAPDYPFEYEYLSDTYRKAYRKEFIQTKLTGLFTLFAILIVCLGLFAITSIIINQRTKEIGIRKVNGASNNDIIWLLLSDILIWISIACIIALPFAYYFMNRWLQNFAYKTNISWPIFVISSLLAYFIGIATVLMQTWRAARRNPVESLRYE